MTIPAKEWQIWCDGNQYRQHAADGSFPTLLTLARIVNNLRYHHVAPMSALSDNSPGAARQRITSFLNVCGALYEALLFTQRLGQHFRDEPSFHELGALLRDKEIRQLRNGPLKRLRHQVVYHHNEGAVATAVRLMADGDKYVFASGTTFSKADVYYELADIAVFQYALPDQGDGRTFQQRSEGLFKQVAALSIRFGNAADKLIAARLAGPDWHRSYAA